MRLIKLKDVCFLSNQFVCACRATGDKETTIMLNSGHVLKTVATVDEVYSAIAGEVASKAL